MIDGRMIMEIIAHRGIWKNELEKNTKKALFLALEHGYGIETDIRDFQERLVLSHDIATPASPALVELFEYYKKNNFKSKIALNVKADGIQHLLIKVLQTYQIENYFLFDMSIPEQVVNCNLRLKFFTRNSDIEEQCVLYQQAEGVWVDSFYNENWLTETVIRKHLDCRKHICIVSPELHHKSYTNVWKMLKDNKYDRCESVYLCTDNPEMAKEFFGI